MDLTKITEAFGAIETTSQGVMRRTLTPALNAIMISFDEWRSVLTPMQYAFEDLEDEVQILRKNIRKYVKEKDEDHDAILMTIREATCQRINDISIPRVSIKTSISKRLDTSNKNITTTLTQTDKVADDNN